MRRRAGTILGASLSVFVIFIILQPREPSYKGKTLSDWIVSPYRREEGEERREAILRLGTNSIPLLLDWLQQSDRPSLSEKVQEMKYGMLSWLERRKLIKPKDHLWKTDMKGSRRALALRAFEEIGPEGRAAIPALIKMLATPSAIPDTMSETAAVASLALSKMAPYSLSPLIEAAASTNDQIYALAAVALASIGPDAKAAIPTIQTRYNDKRPEVRVGAAEIVSKLGGDPTQFMPTIIAALRELDLNMLSFATDILLNHKADAKDAIPVLEERLAKIPSSTTNLNERGARDQLNNVLRQLAPETRGETRAE